MLIEIRLLEKHFNVNLVYKSQFPPLLQNKVKNLYNLYLSIENKLVVFQCTMSAGVNSLKTSH